MAQTQECRKYPKRPFVLLKRFSLTKMSKKTKFGEKKRIFLSKNVAQPKTRKEGPVALEL